MVGLLLFWENGFSTYPSAYELWAQPDEPGDPITIRACSGGIMAGARCAKLSARRASCVASRAAC